MVDDLISYLFLPVAQGGIILGIVEAIKKWGLRRKYLPSAAIVVGAICGILVYGILIGYGVLKGAMIGIALGMASNGSFEFGKYCVRDDKDKDKNKFSIKF